MQDAPERESAARAAQASGWTRGLELPPRYTVSQWADAHRFIAAGTSPEPGRWRTDRTPYLREPMDAFCDPDIHTVVLMMSSQVAKTEALVNVAGYFIDADPAPQMFVLPTLELADSFSTKRFTPTIEASPNLLDRVGRTMERSSSTTIREKSYPGGDIVFSGANSSASLASRPRRVVLLDEIDKYKANIGKDGNPIKQAFQRGQNFWNRKFGLASTPTLEGFSEIADWFKKSDQRHFEVPCSHCGTFQSLDWEQVDWPGRETSRARPAEAHYTCTSCGSAWDQREVHLAVRAGRWRPRSVSHGIAGFHVWAIYSPWVSMADLAREWEDSRGKPGDEQTFVNLKLGRTYNPTKSATTTPEQLLARREDYGPDADGSYTLPADVLLVTCHVDVQADRFEVQYLGWGSGDEKWVLDYRVKHCDTSVPAHWDDLDGELLLRTFRHPLGGSLGIEATAIDAGYLQQRVLDFARERRAAFRQVYAVKGVSGFGQPIWRQSEQKFSLGAKLHLVGVDDGKTTLYQELASQPTAENPEARVRVHFPRHLPLDYFEQLVAERIRVEYVNGRPVRKWVLPTGKRNEALDTAVGAMAARYSLSVDYEARRAARQDDAPKISMSGLAQLFKKG